MAEESGINDGAAKSSAIAKRGVKTAQDFSNLMSAVMSGLLDGSIDPAVGKVVCNASGQLLKMVELHHQVNNGNESRGDLLLPLPTDKPSVDSPELEMNRNGLIKCNQCDARLSPRDLPIHKRTKHPTSDVPAGIEEKSLMGSTLK